MLQTFQNVPRRSLEVSVLFGYQALAIAIAASEDRTSASSRAIDADTEIDVLWLLQDQSERSC